MYSNRLLSYILTNYASTTVFHIYWEGGRERPTGVAKQSGDLPSMTRATRTSPALSSCMVKGAVLPSSPSLNRSTITLKGEGLFHLVAGGNYYSSALRTAT